jgi:hypothetical protein
MAESLYYNMFPLKNESNDNDAYREDGLILEYFQVSVTIASLEATVEVPTNLDQVIGLIDLNFVAAASDPTDSISLLTDGVISSAAVTVNVTCLDVADGAITIKGFLVGKRLPAAITLG